MHKAVLNLTTKQIFSLQNHEALYDSDALWKEYDIIIWYKQK